MRHLAIIGSGPAGFYTAEAALKAFGGEVRIDMIDRLPVPYGLIRFGVAPDHQSIKAVTGRYETVAASSNVRFLGNVRVGDDVTIPELGSLYDAVILATGAPHDRALEVPGADLPGVHGSAAFVGWYNGHPDFAALDPALDGPHVVIVGHGNVALDCARILAKTDAEFEGSDIVEHAREALGRAGTTHVTILGRRGPHQIAMTPKELGELGQLERACPSVDPADLPDPASDVGLDPGHRKSMKLLREFAALPAAAHNAKCVNVDFDFFASPVRIEGNGKVERMVVERTRVDADGDSVGTGETYDIPCSMVITCIGYRTPPLEGVPYDRKTGRFANEDGRILPGLYCVGWARRGPTGTIGTNRPDGYAIVERIAGDIGDGGAKAGGPALDALLKGRDAQVVTFEDWKRIEAAEEARAHDGAPREKFVHVEDLIAARGS